MLSVHYRRWIPGCTGGFMIQLAAFFGKNKLKFELTTSYKCLINILSSCSTLAAYSILGNISQCNQALFQFINKQPQAIMIKPHLTDMARPNLQNAAIQIHLSLASSRFPQTIDDKIKFKRSASNYEEFIQTIGTLRTIHCAAIVKTVYSYY